MARWLTKGQFHKVWYDPDQWQFGLSFYAGAEGVGVHIGFGPFDITFERDY